MLSFLTSLAELGPAVSVDLTGEGQATDGRARRPSVGPASRSSRVGELIACAGRSALSPRTPLRPRMRVWPMP